MFVGDVCQYVYRYVCLKGCTYFLQVMGVPYLIIFLLGEWLLHGGIMAQSSLPGKTRSCKVSVKIRQISFHAFYRVFRARWKMCEYLYPLDRFWKVGLNILSGRPFSHCTVAEFVL